MRSHALRQSWSVKSFKREAQHSQTTSEKGFLELAGREADIPLRDLFLQFRELVSADMAWADARKARFRKRASYIRFATLLLTASSTVVLGIQSIPARAEIALPMVALVTMLGGLEAFHAWRPRWVLMEEAQGSFNHIRDEMDYYIVTTPPTEMNNEVLHDFFVQQQAVWNDISRRWVEFRKLDRSPQSDRGVPQST
jgi:hypothetical protein